MSTWTVSKNFTTATWLIERNGKIHQNFLNHNGSPQSSRQKCERELASILVCEFYKDAPERAYRVAHDVIKLAESSYLSISISEGKFEIV